MQLEFILRDLEFKKEEIMIFLEMYEKVSIDM